MTALLLRRELLRQLPIAGVSALLGLLAFLVVRLGAPLVLRPIQAAEVLPYAPQAALGMVVLVAPWLLGVSALAPDIESGAAAFLGALPLRRTRMTAARLAVAVALSLATVAPFLLFVLVQAGLPTLRVRDVAGSTVVVVALGLTPLAAGALAAVVTGRSLPAFAATPLLAGAAGAAGSVIAGGLAQVGDAGAVAGVAAIPLALLALVHVGVRRGVGVRPGDGLRFGLGAVVALVVTSGGLGGAAYAYQLGSIRWTERGWSSRGPLVAWRDVRHRGTYPLFSEGEVVVLPPDAPRAWLRGERPAGTRLAPHLLPLELSPDGRRLLACDLSDPRGAREVVLDATSGAEVWRHEGEWDAWRATMSPLGDGFGDVTGRAWRRGQPVVLDRGTVRAQGDERLAPPLAHARPTCLLGRWALLVAPDGVHAWDLDAGSCPRRWPEATGARLLEGGLVALLEPGSTLRLVRLDDGETTLRAPLPGGLEGVALDVVPAPDGSAALVLRTVVQPVDPSDRRERPLLVRDGAATECAWHASPRAPFRWSPDGRRLLVPYVGLVDVTRPGELATKVVVPGDPYPDLVPLGFGDATTLVATSSGGGLWAVDVDSGARRPLPHPLPAASR